MTPAELSCTVLRAVRRAVDEDVLRAPVPERAAVERPRPGGRGDYATNVALKLAGAAGRPAREVAEVLRALLLADGDGAVGGLVDVEVTGPGFLNFTLARDAHALVVRTVLERGSHSYGHGRALAGDLVHVGSGPHADAVARLVHAQGATVVRVEDTDDGAGAALAARLGLDAAVWSLVWPTAVPTPDGLLVQRETNPLFRVRYAHARTRALVRNASQLGFHGDGGVGGLGGVEPRVGGEPLLRLLSDYPGVLDAAARHRAPDRLARHLDLVAEVFFRFHDDHPVLPLGDEKPSVAHRSRLALAEATGTVLAGGLSLLGISAPDHL